MSTEWRSCTLGDVLTLQRGFDLPEHIRQQGDIPVVSSSGICGWHSAFKVRGPGVVTGRSGTLGQVFYIKEDFWPLNTTLYVRDFKGNDPLFISYLLKTLNFSHQSSAAAVPSLNRNFVHPLPVTIPPLPIQQKIAAILSSYDDLIENNTRRIAILEGMAQSLYREWFVHFRFPGHEKNAMVESELGMIPEGWEVVKLGKAVELAYGKALKADDRIPGDIPVYGSSGITGHHNYGLVKGPSIIVGRKGNVGSIFWADKDFFPIDTVFFVRSKISLYYVYYNLKQQHFINNDAAVPGLNRNQAYLLPFLLPQHKILTEFQKFVEPVFEQLQILVNRNANLRRTRDLLLPKLISGELDVEGMEVAMGSEMVGGGRV